MTKIQKNSDHKDYGSAEGDIGELYEDTAWNVTNRTRKWLIAIGTLVAVFLLYLFCFLLPQLFIPESVDLEGIRKVSSLDVMLVPVSAETVKSWRVAGIEDTWSDDEAEGDFSDEDDIIPDSEDSYTELIVKKKQKERLILIGDIHGQYREFRKLLRKVKYRKDRDHLIVLGDFITKGPQSLKVLQYLIDNDVDCVLGNHEYYVLQNYARYHGIAQAYFVNGTTPSFRVFSGFNDDPEFLLAKKLQRKHVQYINSCPVMKELGRVPLHSKRNNGKYGFAEGIAVHAGLKWDLLQDLNAQDPETNLEMRAYLKPFYNETTSDPSEPGAVSWSKIWNQKQKAGEVDRSAVVYYGHDAGKGLNIKKFSKGLDSGCYKGGKLSAMVLWQEKGRNDEVKYKEALVQQKC